MDLPSLVVVLRAALSPSPQERKEAEENLNKFQHTPQHLVRLLQIIVDGNCEMAVRQVASIHFKNFVGKHWSPNEHGEQQIISSIDKAAVRDHILEFVACVPPLLRVQLGECLKTIINADYPEQWPSLLPWVKHNLQAQQVYGALYVLRILSRKYEFKSEEERTPVYLIIDEAFPPVLNIFNSLVNVPNPTVEIAELIKLICKIFWSSIYLEIPKQLFDPNIFNAWMVLFLTMLERPVPIEGQPVDPELRKSWEWWKVKKWTVHIMNRLYTRFGDPKLLKPENKPFAQMFQKNFAGRILECHLGILNVIRCGGYLPDRVTNLILQYLSSSLSKSNTYQILKPQLDTVLFEIIFPLMCFNDNDHKLWQEDPHEYVRKGYDIIEDLYSPRTASIDFVTELVRKRGKENLQRFITYIVEIFRRYDEATPDCKPYRQKDGALLAIGALSDKLKQTEPYKSQLEHMLVQHVFPEFRSPVGHLRAKAAWVSGQYAGIPFSDQRNFRAALHNVLSGLRDPELPVRVDSVFALRSFVEACKDLNEIRPILPQLLDDFFKLMNEVENEDLVFTLETIVDKFGEEMAPYALGLCQNLAAAFWKCMQSSEADEEPDESSALAAVGCLRAISTILESVSRLSHLFPQAEPILLPIMQKMLTTDGQEVFEEVLEIVSYMTYFSEKISLQMWSLWPSMISALDEWAIDYFENILVPLDNYISRGTEHFLTCKNPDYQQSLFTVLQSVMGDKNIDDQEIEPAPKLIEAVLQNCKGRVDQWVEPYLRITIDRLQRTERRHLKDLLIEVVANALYYNPVLSLNILHKFGVAVEVFNLWFKMLKEVKKSGQKANFRREHDKKVCILGLTPLLSLPSELIPEESLCQILKALLDLLVDYKEQVAASTNTEEEEDDEMDGWKSDEDEDSSDKEMGVETEDGDEADSQKLQKLAAQARAFQSHSDDEDAESDDDFSDDEEFQSAIDDVDAFVFFSDTMNAMSATNPRRFQNLTQSLDFHYQAVASAVTHHAEERRAVILEEKAEKAGSGSLSQH